MSLQGYVHQLRPRKESHVDHVYRIQDMLQETMLNPKILKNTLRGSSTLRGEVLVQAIKDGTPIETNKGTVTLSWTDNEARICSRGW